MHRRLLAVIAILAGSVAAEAAFGVSILAGPVVAAATDLTVVTDARYEVEPAQHRVRVTVDAVAMNHRRDTTIRRFYYVQAFLAVQPATRGFTTLAPKGARVVVSKATQQYTLLRIDFGRRLYAGKTLGVRFRFDIPDPGGAPNRPVRISDALVSFPVWAFASDGAHGSQASVTFPRGYQVDVASGSLPLRSTLPGGRVVLRSGVLDKPTSFFAFVVADRPGAYTDTSIDVSVSGARVPLTVRAWSDDPGWAKRVGDLLRGGLPVMGDAIGRPWPWDQPMVVVEGASRSGEGDAGSFDPTAGRFQIAYYADPFVVLHVAAHSWFNGRFLADRWANEGFASYYADRALTAMKVKAPVDTLTEPLQAVRIPLNAWGATGDTPATTEAYGRAASLELARRIAARAGDEIMAAVWRDVEGRVAAYQPPATGADRQEPERSAGPPDWRGLIDLLEDRSGRRFDDLWREWVVRPQESSLLEARARARESYARTLALADGWAIPRAAREALRAWRFDVAESILADTRTVIAQREALKKAAARSGLAVPTTIRTLFETEGRLSAASSEAMRGLAIIDALDAAGGAAPVTDDPITKLGLIGIDPAAKLASARAAFEEGRLDDAITDATAASTDSQRAWIEGRRRLLVLVAFAATTSVMAASAVGWMRRRRTDTATSPSTG